MKSSAASCGSGGMRSTRLRSTSPLSISMITTSSTCQCSDVTTFVHRQIHASGTCARKHLLNYHNLYFASLSLQSWWLVCVGSDSPWWMFLVLRPAPAVTRTVQERKRGATGTGRAGVAGSTTEQHSFRRQTEWCSDTRLSHCDVYLNCDDKQNIVVGHRHNSVKFTSDVTVSRE